MDDLEKRLFILIQQFLIEIKSENKKRELKLTTSLDQALGLGSLEKAELINRIENRFSIHLSEKTLTQANTIQDLLIAIRHAHPSQLLTKEPVIFKPIGAPLDVSHEITFTGILKKYNEHKADQVHIYFQEESGNEIEISYGKLFKKAYCIAAEFQARGLQTGDTVSIMLPTCEFFFYVFFGILLAGGIPVPIYPPIRLDQIEDYAKREILILKNAEIRFLVTVEEGLILGKLLQSFVPSLNTVLTEKNFSFDEATPLREPDITTHSSALIQYTSGSTGNPKGVLLSHFNLLSNIRAAALAIHAHADDSLVSWLPLYHDMGLIGAWLGSLYHGIPVTIMSPLTFLAHPERWLWAIHYHRATLSAGPNFSYELCIRKWNEKTYAGLNLNSWRIAFNGAEPIHEKTLKRFTNIFSAYGLKKNALMPVYGLAESTVALAFPEPNSEPRIDRVDRHALQNQQRAIPLTHEKQSHIDLISCGKAIPGHEIRIVDENNHIVPERVVGQLQFRGPSSMQGYYRNPEATQKIYHDGWWDTGDYAYLADNELFIAGRKKDMIIKAGHHLFPHEIEETTEHVEHIRKGCVIAFGITDVQLGTEKLIIVAETAVKNKRILDKIKNKITERVTQHIGEPPDKVVLVPYDTIPKTSSGKLQRSKCQQLYLENKLEIHRLPFWIQLIKLSFIYFIKKNENVLKQAGSFIYTFYVFLILIITLPLPYLSLFCFSLEHRRLITKYWARCVFKFAFCPITLSNESYLLKNKNFIITPNHASYIDSFLLLAILPTNCIFVGKKELLNTLIIRTFIKKLKFLTVDRIDFSKSLEDLKQIEDVLKEHRSVIIFPEGTFTGSAGIHPFKFGAFKLAAENHLDILPIAIQGTRWMLPDSKKCLRWGKIHIHVCEPLHAQGTDWESISRLAAQARTLIAEHSGEGLMM